MKTEKPSNIITSLHVQEGTHGELIHSVNDPYGLIQVFDTEQARSLYFDSDIEQSRFYFDSPFRPAFEYQQLIIQSICEKAEHQPLHRTLMLGMGGGTIANHLHHLFPKLQIHIVELRSAVIEIAYDYFSLSDSPEIDVIHEDAAVYVTQANTPYDVIIVDLFDDQGIPAPFTQLAFQQQLHANLCKQGLLLFNLWNHSDVEIQQQVNTIKQHWQTLLHDDASASMQQHEVPSTENLVLAIQR